MSEEGDNNTLGEGDGDSGQSLLNASTYEWAEGTPEKFLGKRPEDVVASYQELETRLSKPAEAPESYDLTLPEGVEGEFDTDDELLTKFMPIAKEPGLTNDQFNGAVGYYVQSMLESQVDPETQLANEMAQLGSNAGQMLHEVDQFLQANMDADDYKEAAQALVTADAVKLVHKLIGLSAPAVPPIDGGANPDGLTEAGLHELQFATNERGERLMGIDPAYKAKVEDYRRRLHGVTT